MKEVVDLGLPSGTLWYKYNLDVDPKKLEPEEWRCNLGLHTAEDWYGKYYAWGELEGNKTNKDGKIYFSWNNYKFGNEYNLTKYCNILIWGLNGFTDNLTELLPEDDVAYQNKKLHNYKFHIPTKEQCEELINCTVNYWVNNYDPNKTLHNPKNDRGIKGLNGRVFEGNNKNQLFIPASGCYFDSGVGSCCYLWSSSLNLEYSDRACNLSFDSYGIGMNTSYRCIGYSIRPVINL